MCKRNAKPIILSQSLPQLAYDAKQVQQNEPKIAAIQGVSMYSLMENAGAAVFSQIKCSYDQLTSLLVVCGKGNNGGDGFIVARLAAQAGIKVVVLLVSESPAELNNIKGDALTALNALHNTEVNIIQTSELALAVKVVTEFNGGLIVDCIFGIGFKGQLSPFLKILITTINEHDTPVLSVDIPSGLSADTGNVDSTAIIAQQTVSFIVLKRGLLTGQSANYVGELYLADLGVGVLFSQKVASKIFIQGQKNLPILPKRQAASHKGNVGLALAVGGNEGMPGAIRLSAEAALRSGVSLIAVCCHHKSQSMVFSERPEIMLAPATSVGLAQSRVFNKARVFIVGPGLGQNHWAKQLFSLVSNQAQPCVIDADALQLLSQSIINGSQRFKNNWVLTPHSGEAASLLACSIADIEADRFNAVINIANKYGGICVLKGAGTLISDGKEVWINTSGNAGMASGGMGDVLSGIIAAMLIQLPDSLAAVRFAVYIHGRAADIIAHKNGQRGMLASDLFPEIQRLVN